MVQLIRISSFKEFDNIINRIVQERRGQNIFLVLFGNENPYTGKSWCPDCVNAEPLIRQQLDKVPADTVYIEVPVGTRADGKPDNPYRLHPRIQLKSIPTLIKWTANAETDRRLVERECTQVDLLNAFFSV
ncbi:5146_t:CDS:2 [Funneliformis geosporum]|uniref:5146_t:CDS:1 n=1 Tax=Funneliformis geosporum TaxID=1117311 RepID=A0A9W4SPN5_9GLOM|nr:5146_t:CDS:2 [Funneliformis geosporum]